MSTVDPGAGVGAPGGGSPSPAGSGVPAAPPPADGAAPSSGASVQQPVELLRRQYEETKSKYEPYEKLGAKPEELGRSHQTYQKMFSEATQLAGTLGYSEAELQEAFSADPVRALSFLRQAAEKANGSDKPLSPAEVQKLIQQGIKTGLKPFEQEREMALDRKAETAFDGEFERQFKTSWPEGLPDSNREAISGLAWSMLSEDKDAYSALRGKGDVSKVAAAFESAKKTFLKIITDYGAHERKRVGGKPPAEDGTPAPKKAQSLDDMIHRLGNRSIPDNEVFTTR